LWRIKHNNKYQQLGIFGICRYSVFFGISNTEDGIGIDI